MKVQRLMLAAIIGLGLLSCTDVQSPTDALRVSAATAPPSASDLQGLLPTLLGCTPATYDSVSQAIGPAGGTLTVGPHTFVVPPGALDSTVTITGVVPADSYVHVRFAPQGLTFATPATLTLSYAACPLESLVTLPLVVYVNDSLSVLEIEPSIPDLLHSTVTGRIHHFSGYAVAY